MVCKSTQSAEAKVNVILFKKTKLRSLAPFRSQVSEMRLILDLISYTGLSELDMIDVKLF